MAIKKLYGTFDSLDTLRALASIFEHVLDFEFIPINLDTGEHKTDSFLSLSPFGHAPVYQDDELTLFESRATMRFISRCYAKPEKEQVYVVPKLQGIASSWIDIEDFHLSGSSAKLREELVEKPKKGLPTDKGVVAKEEAKLGKLLDAYEERLTNCKYLGGDKFTSADLTHLPHLHHLMSTPVKRLFEERPKVSAWCRSILSRPAWTKVVDMVEENKV